MIKDPRLLVVEDDVAVSEAVTEVLQAENYQVSNASSSKEAISQVEQGGIDLVLLDLVLGNEDGWTVFQTLKQIRPGLPIIIASAERNRLSHPSARRAEAILEKPFDIPTLLTTALEPKKSFNNSFTNSHDWDRPKAGSSKFLSWRSKISASRLAKGFSTGIFLLFGLVLPFLNLKALGVTDPNLRVSLQIQ